MIMHSRFRNAAVALTLTACGLGCSSSSSSSNDAVGGGKPDGGADVPNTLPRDAPGDMPAAHGPASSQAVMRGKYLANSVSGCAECHTPSLADGSPDPQMLMAGNESFFALPNGDKLPSRNLTSDETGLKNRTDQEIKDMFLNGVRPAATGSANGATGEPLNPFMPYYVFHNMTSEDADAIVAYLRTLPAVKHMIPKRGASFDVPMHANYLDLSLIKSPKYDDAATQQSAVRGRYLAAQVGLCVECHTPRNPPTSLDVLDAANIFAGGDDFSALFAATLMIKPVSKNLTGDEATGLGKWTAMDVVTVLKDGKAKDGTGICPPMPVEVYKTMTKDDMQDIANYIKSLPPIVHSIPDMCVFPPVPSDGGAPEAAPEPAADAGNETGG